jgi:hypothetical protein
MAGQETLCNAYRTAELPRILLIYRNPDLPKPEIFRVASVLASPLDDGRPKSKPPEGVTMRKGAKLAVFFSLFAASGLALSQQNAPAKAAASKGATTVAQAPAAGTAGGVAAGAPAAATGAAAGGASLGVAVAATAAVAAAGAAATNTSSTTSHFNP